MNRHEEVNDQFFEWIDKKINVKGHTDAKIADDAGISRPMMSMMRSGKRGLSMEMMMRIAEALGGTLTFGFKDK